MATEIRATGLFAVDDAIRSGDFDAAISRMDNTPSGILEKWLGEPWKGRTRGPSAGQALVAPFGYHDVEVVQLLHALHAEPDPDAQDTLYAWINEIFRRDMPVTFLFPMVENHVAHRRIRGFRQGWPEFLGTRRSFGSRRSPAETVGAGTKRGPAHNDDEESQWT